MIYLDHNATTPISPEVLEAMMPYLTESWGNPSSGYRFGFQLKQALNTAREQVASLLSASPTSVFFTGCATESNNAAIRAALACTPEKRHIVTSQVEHSSVLAYCKELEETGYTVTYLSTDEGGQISASDLTKAITDHTAVVSLMWANNETGVVSPIEVFATICMDKDVLFHCDAVQAAGKLAIDLATVPVDFLTLSAHKVNGPKGCGALVTANNLLSKPVLFGGNQENGRRGGTENVAAIVGFGKAAELAGSNLAVRSKHSRELRDKLENHVLADIPGSWVNGKESPRLPNTTNIGFPNVNSDVLVGLLDTLEICVSSGSACLANSLSPSHVIYAMTGSHDKARQSLRLSVSYLNTEAEIDRAIESVKFAVRSFQVSGLMPPLTSPV